MFYFIIKLPLATAGPAGLATGDPPQKILYYDNSVIFIIPVLFIMMIIINTLIKL